MSQAITVDGTVMGENTLSARENMITMTSMRFYITISNVTLTFAKTAYRLTKLLE